MKLSGEQLERFERAFTSGLSGCRRTCHCGREFYDAGNSCDWEDGEFEALEKDANATAVDYSVGTVVFEGREYAMDCECWKARASNIVGFVLGHDRQIAEFLSLEKGAAVNEANRKPLVREPAAMQAGKGQG